jgi:hypothetical protein
VRVRTVDWPGVAGTLEELPVVHPVIQNAIASGAKSLNGIFTGTPFSQKRDKALLRRRDGILLLPVRITA